MVNKSAHMRDFRPSFCCKIPVNRCIIAVFQATQSTTWLCLDSSSLDHSWFQHLPELLGQNKTLTLSSGEHLLMDDASFKLIFETGDLKDASPAALLNSVTNHMTVLQAHSNRQGLPI